MKPLRPGYSMLRPYAEQRELAHQIIDFGYKLLSLKLHPDKGGSHDDMARLNHVRDRLIEIAEYREFQVKVKRGRR